MTNTFEKTYQIDPQREKTDNLDKHRCIELSDYDYMKLKQKMLLDNTRKIDSQSVEPSVLNIEENLPKSVKKKTKSKAKK